MKKSYYKILLVLVLMMGFISCTSSDHNNDEPLLDPTVTDVDGNIYNVVEIGTQIWLQKNLDVSHYRNGDVIPQVQDFTEWSNLTTGAWCYCYNDEANGIAYGKLYNWYAVNDPRGLAPQGWHIPTDAEWSTLTTFLGGELVAGIKMKAEGSQYWEVPVFTEATITNNSNFTALPGGCRQFDGQFFTTNRYGYWWSSTALVPGGWFRWMSYDSNSVARDAYHARSGFSIRCLRN